MIATSDSYDSYDSYNYRNSDSEFFYRIFYRIVFLIIVYIYKLLLDYFDTEDKIVILMVRYNINGII